MTKEQEEDFREHLQVLNQWVRLGHRDLRNGNRAFAHDMLRLAWLRYREAWLLVQKDK